MLRPKLNRIWTSSSPTLRRDPGDAKYIQGWISEIPTFQVLNYLQYKVDTTLLALAERGIAEWGPDVQYGLNSLAWDETNKVIYISTVGSPDRTKAPSTNPTQWVASSIQVSRAEYDSVVAAINAHIRNVTGNPHKLTAGRLNAYNKTEIDNIVSQYRTLVANHANDKNNPHQLTATIIGAVPVTGGTYTGDVTFNSNVYFDVNKVNTIRKTGGMFLQNGTGIIGITTAGVGVVGDTTSTTPIVTEASYPALKQLQEPDYAIPPPAVVMDLMKSINMRMGIGYVNTNFNPAYSPVTNAMYLTNNTTGNQNLIGDVASPIGGGECKDFTIACDILSPTERIPTDSTGSIFIGLNKTVNSIGHAIGIRITGASYVTATRQISGVLERAGYQLTGPVNTWYRFVMTVSGTELKLFLNGVLVASTLNATTTTDTTGGAVRFIAYPKASSDLNRTWHFRNYRVWTQALTEKQVSTL